MITLHETLQVDRDADAVFAYVADFRTTVEWDATAQRAQKLTPGPVAPGTQFRVTCALPLGSIDIDYRVSAFEPPRRIELQGRSRLFEITDRITIEDSAGGVSLDYRAEFRFPRWLRGLEDRLRPGLEQMGRESIAGMQAALADRNPAPSLQGDSCSLPARLKRFTRFGYSSARQRWLPMSASLAGRHAVVTGATSGLGAVTALELARRGAALTLVVRDGDKARQLSDAISAETGNREIAIELADLSLLGEVDAVCARLRASARPVDILVNNAGALFGEYARTAEGHERSLALLLLAPYRMTLGLLPLLEASGAARVINVVSGGMYTQQLDLAKLVDYPPQDFSGPVAYAQAKRALMAVTQEWAAQWRAAGIAVNAMHPGWVDTPGLGEALPGFHRLTRYLLRTPEQGADTIVWLAAASEAAEVSGGLFLDREAQPLYLKAGTQESPAQRAAVLDWLRQFAGQRSDPHPPGSESRL